MWKMSKLRANDRRYILSLGVGSKGLTETGIRNNIQWNSNCVKMLIQ